MNPSSLDRFPYLVSTLAELDPLVQDAFRRELEPDEAIDQLTVAPRQELIGIPSAWQHWLGLRTATLQTPAVMIALTSERLLVATITQPGSSPAVASIPTAALLWVELGEILIFSWFECVWAAPDGVQRLCVLFNAVGVAHFERMRRQLCRSMIQQADLKPEQGDRKRRLLADLPYKFGNMIDNILLLADERIDDVIYRPALWQQRWRIWRRMRAPAVALVLSNYHLLLFRETNSTHMPDYGWIARYCSLRRVRGLALQEDEAALRLDITVGVGGAERTFGVLFPSDLDARLRQWLR